MTALSMAAGSEAEPLDVLIVGSGFGGLGMAIHLRRAGIASFLILERAQEVGGTWYANTYPGCACDIPSHLYSFSFETNPDWTRMYPTQPEIWAYLRRCADRYDLRRHLRLGCELSGAVYDEARDLWRVSVADGSTLHARVLVSAMGGLSRPAIPRLPGIERFLGRAFHSAQWDHDVDFRDKRVAVIGTGASAIQFVPKLVPLVARLHLFQRTAPWVLPKMDFVFKSRTLAMFRHLPGAARLFRHLVYWRQELGARGFVREPARLVEGQKLALGYLRMVVPDPVLRARLTPDYTLGCKRILISNDYYPSLQKPNVELVTAGVREVREHGIVGNDGIERPVDAIVYGTGFRATDLFSPIRIVGRNGVDINEAWAGGAEAYLGITVSGFPNLFLLGGPNTGLGHNSMIFMLEAQMHYVMQCLRRMKRTRVAALEVAPQAQQAFVDEVARRMRHTVWQTGCKSWYLNAQGRNVSLWPDHTYTYWARTRRVRSADYLAAPD